MEIPIASEIGVDMAVESEAGQIGLDDDPFINGGLQVPGNTFDRNSMRLLGSSTILGCRIDCKRAIGSGIVAKIL